VTEFSIAPRRAAIPARLAFPLGVGARMAASAVGYAVFRLLDWGWLQFLVRDAVAALLAGWGDGVRLEGPDLLYLGERAHRISADCTYAELCLVVLPFLWFAGASTLRNVGRIAAVVLGIQLLNVARVTAAIHLGAAGVGKLWAHDLPDYLFYWPVLLACVVLGVLRSRDS